MSSLIFPKLDGYGIFALTLDKESVILSQSHKLNSNSTASLKFGRSSSSFQFWCDEELQPS